MDKPRHWFTVSIESQGQFEDLAKFEARRKAELTVLAAYHPRCGAHSTLPALPVHVTRWILEMLRPNTINACCSRVSRNTSGYVICIPDKSGGIVLAEEGPPAYFGSWASFVQRLPADQCVLAVANFFYKQAFDDPPHHTGEIVSKKISVLWSPTAAHSLKDKFVLCSTRESFLRNMFGSDSPIQMQASEPEQLGFEEVLDKLYRT
ncbi:hypothetical protein Pelo_9411 [Pelomyxa schiedti]|nr:hypothetical protein Pelo_9411 [Pelomyxa schiedti]